jgi:hypothetical protein
MGRPALFADAPHQDNALILHDLLEKPADGIGNSPAGLPALKAFASGFGHGKQQP